MATIDKDTPLFGENSLSTLLGDIYSTVKKKDKKIDELIDTLNKTVTNPGQAILVVPLIREYLDAAIMNNDQLVKMASVIQRLIAANAKEILGGDEANNPFMDPNLVNTLKDLAAQAGKELVMESDKVKPLKKQA